MKHRDRKRIARAWRILARPISYRATLRALRQLGFSRMEAGLEAAARHSWEARPL